MASDVIYELSLPILRDDTLDEDEKTDKLEDLLRKEASLEGRALQHAILGVLWRQRDATNPPTASPPPRNVVARKGSPAPWQVPRAATPLASPSLATASPASTHSFIGPSAMSKVKSSGASPFTSPRPSPRPGFVLPLPQSPSLHSYEFAEPSTHQTDYGDFSSDTVDWLVNDDEFSRPTSSSATSAFESNLSGAAAPWVQPQQAEMSPYDMLRSILGESKTDEEIEAALEANAYDLSATLMALMGSAPAFEECASTSEGDGNTITAQTTQTTQPITISQTVGNPKSSILCKYWVATGSCLRADCRFSHEYGTHLCKFWMEGNCLAGENCVFSHDPATLMANLNVGSSNTPSEVGGAAQPNFQVQDYDAFPNIQGNSVNIAAANFHRLAHTSSPRSFGSGPTSRHSSRPTTPLPQVDDTDAFPALGAGAGKATRKHHGKRGGHGHAHTNKDGLPDSARMSPSPAISLLKKGLMKSRSYVGREQAGITSNIPAPEHVPWLETGERANPAYIKARQDAFKHSGLRNKFLQSAAQAWNRQDVRAAKALSLRGQSENELMRKAHREAARVLYEAQAQAQKSGDTEFKELYVDLHGLHPEEAVAYLARMLREQRVAEGIRGSAFDDADTESENGINPGKEKSVSKPLYAITGTGHHSKGGKDKVGKAVRVWLTERGFVFREFSVPGDRGNVGGILGIDVRSGDPEAKGVRPNNVQGQSIADDKSASEDGKQEDNVEKADQNGDQERHNTAKAARRPVMEMKIPTGPRGLRT